MRRTKSWIVGIACGALCAVCVFMYLQDAGAQVDAARAEALERFGGEQVEVCVAKRDIAAGEVVDASSFEKRMWVTALLPEDPLTQDSDVLGKQVTSTVLKGEVLTSRRFEESPSSIDVPGELTAVSVPARDVQTVGGALRPGMFVDVYATGSAGSAGSAGTTLIAHSVLVLATNASSSSKSGADSVSWVTLALDPANVQEIVSVAQGSELYFTLPGEDVPEPTVSKSLDANEGQKGSSVQQRSDAASDSGSSQVSQPDGRSAAADASQAEGSASNSDSDEGASHER
ncbi:MAG: Flp pilus assembly protein CpaB [Ellagibacter isourolithinifaciens]|nr:Flp pilus assembly protein CpaB [Ellagibacter isourolithinifaciens]